MSIQLKWPKCLFRLSLALIVAGLATFALTGCERKERVLDVQTPGADVKVDRNLDTGEIEVDVQEN
jgi:hypothetical protein